MRDHEQQIREAGASVLAVGLGGSHYAQRFREQSGITFPLLVDTDRQAYEAIGLKSASLFHLTRRDNFAARKRAQERGHRQGRLGKDPLQLGGSFIFGPGNEDLFVHISETFGDNTEISDLLSELRS